MSSVSEVLEQAAELIRRHGWVQRKYGTTGEGYCIIGAIIAVPKHESGYPAIEALREELGGQSVMLWNDTEGRTKEEVLELLERAARDR